MRNDIMILSTIAVIDIGFAIYDPHTREYAINLIFNCIKYIFVILYFPTLRISHDKCQARAFRTNWTF